MESVTINHVKCSACVKPILNALGHALKSLDIIESKLDLAQLVPCCYLERLTIWEGCSIINDGADGTASLISLPFLPVLKSFSSSVCLGEWSPLFESKTSLTKLGLNCSHIGIGVIIQMFSWLMNTRFQILIPTPIKLIGRASSGMEPGNRSLAQLDIIGSGSLFWTIVDHVEENLLSVD